MRKKIEKKNENLHKLFEMLFFVCNLEINIRLLSRWFDLSFEFHLKFKKKPINRDYKLFKHKKITWVFYFFLLTSYTYPNFLSLFQISLLEVSANLATKYWAESPNFFDFDLGWGNSSYFHENRNYFNENSIYFNEHPSEFVLKIRTNPE